MKNALTLTSIFLCFTLASCSSIKSTTSNVPTSSPGLNYYMPKKDVIVTVSVDEKSKLSKVSISASPAYPDLTKKFVLNHSLNLIGKNTMDIGVNEAGLLISSKSTTVSNVNDVFKSLATAAGSIKVLELQAPTPCIPGTFTYVFSIDTLPLNSSPKQLICNLSVSIIKKGQNISNNAFDTDNATEYSGVFYRQSEPYLVTVSDSSTNAVYEAIILSPSQSKTSFMPISKTFFANNEASFTFEDGIPKSAKQDTDGELISLVKIPADIISAYFAAIGSIFNSFKTNDTAQADALAANLKLELERKKYTDCKTAIETKVDATIKANCS